VRADALVAGEQYYLKAKSEIGLIWRFYLIPWFLDTAWARVSLENAEGGDHAPRP